MKSTVPNDIATLYWGGDLLTGEVGIEVEVEGRNIPERIPRHAGCNKSFWNSERDGSLRGESMEYVLKKPIDRKDVPSALTQLYTAFKDSETQLEDTGRAGVHVHVNIRDLTVDQVFSFIMLYLVFEQVLVKYCGEEREGNLFCLRATDAEFLLSVIRGAIQTNNLRAFHTDNIRYAAINLAAISKYGSLEFRSMKSPVTEEVINNWVGLLLKLKDASRTYTVPSDIVLGVSEAGGEYFARSVFEDLTDTLTCDNWGKAVMDGMRLIQPLAMAYNSAAIARVPVDVEPVIDEEDEDEEDPWEEEEEAVPAVDRRVQARMAELERRDAEFRQAMENMRLARLRGAPTPPPRGEARPRRNQNFMPFTDDLGA